MAKRLAKQVLEEGCRQLAELLEYDNDLTLFELIACVRQRLKDDEADCESYRSERQRVEQQLREERELRELGLAKLSEQREIVDAARRLLAVTKPGPGHMITLAGAIGALEELQQAMVKLDQVKQNG